MKQKLLIIFVLSLAFIFNPILSFAQPHPVTVDDISAQKYFPAALNALQNAKDSIFIAMYFIIPATADSNDPVTRLLDSLVQAKKRGLDIKIILEDSKLKENYLACKILHQANIPVYFDTAASLLHNKIVIIDKEIVLVGSSNWSRQAFLNNQESNVLIHSPGLALHLLEDLSRIRINQASSCLTQEYLGVFLSHDFLAPASFGALLVKNKAEIAFNTYLELLKEETNPVPLELKGLKRSKKKALLSLQDRYNLIKYDTSKKEALLLDPKNKGLAYSKPKDDFFILPYEYWLYGLDKRLSLRAKFIYLVSLCEAAKSTKKPCWFRSQEALAQAYGLSDYTISLGLQELERENILEIKRSFPESEDFQDRLANVYCLNPLVSAEQYQRQVNQLISAYGKELFYQAQKLSNQLNEAKDLEDIQTYIHLIQTYGYSKVKKANSLTAKSKKGSAFYDISYTITQLRKQSHSRASKVIPA